LFCFQLNFLLNRKDVDQIYLSIYRSIPAGRGGSNPSLLCSAHLPLALRARQSNRDLIIRGWDATQGSRHLKCAVPAIYLIRRSIPAPQETEIGVPIRTDLSYLSLQDGSFSARYIYKSLMIELFKFSFAEVLTVQNSNTTIVVPPIVRNPTVIRRFRPRSESEAN
jgi:hypothetical protein